VQNTAFFLLAPDAEQTFSKAHMGIIATLQKL